MNTLAKNVLKWAWIWSLIALASVPIGAATLLAYTGKWILNVINWTDLGRLDIAKNVKEKVVGTQGSLRDVFSSWNTRNTSNRWFNRNRGWRDNIPNDKNQPCEQQLMGELQDIELWLKTRETQTKPPKTPSPIIMSDIIDNLDQQENRLFWSAPLTGGNRFERNISNRIRNKRKGKSVLERIQDIKDPREKIRIVDKFTEMQDLIQKVRENIATPVPTLTIAGTPVGRIQNHTVWNPLEISIGTNLPAGISMTNVIVRVKNAGIELTDTMSNYDPNTKILSIDPDTAWDYEYSISYRDSVGRESKPVDLTVKSVDVPVPPTIPTVIGSTTFMTPTQQITGHTDPFTKIELIDSRDNVIGDVISDINWDYIIPTNLSTDTNGCTVRASNTSTPPLTSDSIPFDIKVSINTPNNTILAPTLPITAFTTDIQKISWHTSPNTDVEVSIAPNQLKNRCTSKSDWTYEMDIQLPDWSHNLIISAIDKTNPSNKKDTRATITVNRNINNLPTPPAPTPQNWPINNTNTQNGPLFVLDQNIKENNGKLELTGKWPANTDVRIKKWWSNWALLTNGNIKTKNDGTFSYIFDKNERSTYKTKREIVIEYDDNGTTKQEKINITLPTLP